MSGFCKKVVWRRSVPFVFVLVLELGRKIEDEHEDEDDRAPWLTGSSN